MLTHSNRPSRLQSQPALAMPAQAVLAATKRSLAALRKRLGGSLGEGVFFLERPFFNVSLQLAVPNVICSPSLAEIQGAINAAAKKVGPCQCPSPASHGSCHPVT